MNKEPEIKRKSSIKCVTPAKAGVQVRDKTWIPASAGMTRWSRNIFFVFFAAIAILTIPHNADASLATFISEVIGNHEVSAETRAAGKVADSQISPSIVLQAPSNPSITAKSTELPPIDDDSVLSPEIARMNVPIAEPINSQISTYTVRPGDTISDIAQMFDVSINTILWANDLSSKSSVRPGQVLVILPVTGITYKVKKGDTLGAIATKFKADQEDIMNYNDMRSATDLAVGNEIIIPSAEITTPPVYNPSRIGGGTSTSYLMCPVRGARVSQGLHGHNGVDLAIAPGTPIRATAGGIVIISRSNGAWNGGYGNFVVVLHQNGTQSLYSHMSRSVVSVNERVDQGEIVGYVGMTGMTTGPHVHFEIRGGTNPFWDQSRCR